MALNGAKEIDEWNRTGGPAVSMIGAAHTGCNDT